MARTIRQYVKANPVPRHHQKAGEKVATSSPPLSAGWAWKPDSKTTRALARGNRALRNARKAAQSPEIEESKMATKKSSKKRTSKKKGTAKKVAKKVAANPNRIPLKKICQQLKIEPKMARRKLRAANLKGHDTQSRWEFTQAQAAKAKEILAA